MNRFHIYAIALGMLLMCVSCRKELCYDHYPAVSVTFAWEQEWERDYGLSHQLNWNQDLHHYAYDEMRPPVPEWVKMIRYFDNGQHSDRFFRPEGAQFEVDEDESCSILFYNGDTEYLIFSDVASLYDVRATATGRTRAGASLQAMQEAFKDSRTTNPPDVIYSAFISKMSGVQSHEVRQLPIRMQPLVYTYLVTYEFEYGIEHVALARGALGGMAEGVYLRSGVTTDEPTIILFDCDIHSDACRCQVRSFGIPGFPDSYFGRAASDDTSSTYSLSLEVKLKNGKTTDFFFDVTDQIKNQPRGGVIRVGGLRIEDEQSAGETSSGFVVDVSGWDDNVEEIDFPPGSFTSH